MISGWTILHQVSLPRFREFFFRLHLHMLCARCSLDQACAAVDTLHYTTDDSKPPKALKP